MAEKFQAPDYFDVDPLLSEEERMIRDTVREWVDDKLLPIIEECDREARFPTELIPDLAEMGLLGANIQGYGCAGISNTAYGLVMQELERGDSGLRSFVSVQGALCMYPILTYGSEEQKETWLPPMARGEKIGCFGLTEPDFGSNPAGMLTTAAPRDDGYVLNGAKMWITNGGICDVAVVWAREDGKIRGFLVERDREGFTVNDTLGKFSLRASVTSELVFEDCWIPAANQLPKAEGLKGPLSCLTQARYGIAWGAVGAAMACYDEALHYTKNRVQFDKPIAAFQLVQRELVYMVTEITKAQLLAWRLGQLKDGGRVTSNQVSMAKRNNVSIALDIARRARDLLGANGITDEYQTGRHMRNLESVITYEGTHNIHTLITGQDITGIPAFN